MIRVAWAIPFLALAVCIAWGTRALRGWRERAAWHRITRANPDLERQFAAIWEEDINRLADEISERLRRLRDCTEGGDA